MPGYCNSPSDHRPCELARPGGGVFRVKRFSAFLLILVLVPCLIVPASATTSDVVDELETQTTYLSTILDACNAIGSNLQSNFRALKTWLGFSAEYSLYDGLKDMFQSLGDGLGERFDDVVDRLDWLDDSVRDVETGILDILEQLYTNGALTIGEYVKGIRSYVLDTYTYLSTTMQTGLEAIQSGVSASAGRLGNLVSMVNQLVTGDRQGASDILEESPPLQTEIDEYEEILSTAPTIDEDAFDTALGDVNGKFNGITTDENGVALFGAFGQLANTQPISVIIPTSAMLAVLSFALFGRTF